MRQYLQATEFSVEPLCIKSHEPCDAEASLDCAEQYT